MTGTKSVFFLTVSNAISRRGLIKYYNYNMLCIVLGYFKFGKKDDTCQQIEYCFGKGSRSQVFSELNVNCIFH